ncbi:MAG: hypothetical protein HYZ28_08025 [Myxococcales bacterium]|nr:hypothetical protein [Myxococcales bacterium]
MSRPSILIVGLIAACGPALPDHTAVEGTVAGISFRGPSALYSVEREWFGLWGSLVGVTILISDDQDACRHLDQREDGVALRATNDRERPTLLLTMSPSGSQTLGKGLSAKQQPGGGSLTRICPSNSSSGCTDARRNITTPEIGEAEIYLLDDPEQENSRPTSIGAFELTFAGNETFKGQFVATPCRGVRYANRGCAQAPGGLGVALGGLVLARLRRAKQATNARHSQGLRTQSPV